ncbi:MAG: bifunctional adenosylcobinamide kinase/adenosylcobinamide-phosphate guanylyltransferase [Anaerolineae bacterium]|nr:bifunctional adenosylcobinamide kinase/adenosylcobinamide-phosphate guanylyltransferase [Anaerolineae bacterium]
MGKSLTLILGGVRSGKSSRAQKMMEEKGGPVLFVATASAGDAEMAERIRVHQLERPAGWATLEASRHVGAAIREQDFKGNILLDCLTLLASNVMMEFPEPVDEQAYTQAMQTETDELLEAYHAHTGEWVIVSNEVGLGVVPAYEMGRYYRDALGRANQQLAAAADRVIFMVAGIPMVVK